MLFKGLIKRYLKFKGWQLVGDKPPIDKFIFIVAPHTSQLDFVMGKVFCSLQGFKPRFLIKKEAFIFPFGAILKRLGGLPVDRGNSQRLTQQLVKQFSHADELIIIITPEGTRKKVKNWKRGFHFLARAAEVPVVLSFIDYKTKRMGIGPVMEMTADFKGDLKRIKAFYRGMEGRHIDRFCADD